MHIANHMEEIAFTVVSKPYKAWDFYTDRASSPHMAAATDECPGLPYTPPAARKHPYTSPRPYANVGKTIGEFGDAAVAPMQLGRSSHKSQGKINLDTLPSVQRPFSCIHGLITPRSWHVAGLSAASFHLAGTFRSTEAKRSTRLSPNSTMSLVFVQSTEVTIVIHVRQTLTQYVMRVGTSEYLQSSILPRLRLTLKGPDTLAFARKVCSWLNLPVGHEESFKPKKRNRNARGRVS
jgi:hypothetical protein